MKKTILGVISALLIAVVTPGVAQANTAPNAFTKKAGDVAWVDVPTADRVQLESFGENYDDYEIYYVPAGFTCTYNSITATGPFLTARDLGSSECVDSGSNPADPMPDNANGDPDGTTPFGFGINFYGTTYTGGWPNTNAGLYFDAPSNDYDDAMSSLIGNVQSSALFVLAGDLDYSPLESNIWTAQTTVDGHNAVVFSWEGMNNCCSDSGNESISVQLVLLDLGNGDFDAWYNYDTLAGFDEGYDAAEFTIDLSQATVGSNVFPVKDATAVPTDCTSFVEDDDFGTFTNSTDQSALTSDLYAKRVSDTAESVSLWTDNTCETAINLTEAQDVQADGNVYVTYSQDSGTTFNAVAMGWGTYTPSSGKIDWVELLHNVDVDKLVDGGTDPLIAKSWNTTVRGRLVIGQRNGVVVGDPSAPALADTGYDASGLMVAGFAAVALGLVAVRKSRRRIS